MTKVEVLPFHVSEKCIKSPKTMPMTKWKTSAAATKRLSYHSFGTYLRGADRQKQRRWITIAFGVACLMTKAAGSGFIYLLSSSLYAGRTGKWRMKILPKNKLKREFYNGRNKQRSALMPQNFLDKSVPKFTTIQKITKARLRSFVD